jgi:hypothetical protein
LFPRRRGQRALRDAASAAEEAGAAVAGSWVEVVAAVVERARITMAVEVVVTVSNLVLCSSAVEWQCVMYAHCERLLVCVE